MTNEHYEVPSWEYSKESEKALGRIPAHLDAQEIIDNSWNNTGDVTDCGIYESVRENVIACFHGTVDMYIDQNCSSF